MLSTNEIHDMIQTTAAGDTDRILDILLEVVEHLKVQEHGIETLRRESRLPRSAFNAAAWDAETQ